MVVGSGSVLFLGLLLSKVGQGRRINWERKTKLKGILLCCPKEAKIHSLR